MRERERDARLSRVVSFKTSQPSWLSFIDNLFANYFLAIACLSTASERKPPVGFVCLINFQLTTLFVSLCCASALYRLHEGEREREQTQTARRLSDEISLANLVGSGGGGGAHLIRYFTYNRNIVDNKKLQAFLQKTNLHFVLCHIKSSWFSPNFTLKKFTSLLTANLKMADLEQEFQKAADDVKNLKARPTDQELLEVYALFKQATVGDNEQPKPSMFALKEKAKHEFWLKKKGESR